MIEVDKDRAEAYGLSIHRLSNRRLRGDNFTMSSGSCSLMEARNISLNHQAHSIQWMS